ncbi:MAG: GtrA family protein, partial [Beijerinckiaceae bacterium]
AAFLRIYGGPFVIALSIGVGTIAGLAVKYMLDKTMIFKFEARDLRHDGAMFARYSLMGVATTLIFWGFEMAFHFAFGTDGMRYLGGAIGLVIGYIVKYQLDKRFVFRTPSA